MVCEQSCIANGDCASGCCTDLRDTGDLVCADAAACTNPCKKTGAACIQGTSTTPDDCCQGSCIESTSTYFSGCRPRCSKDADCLETGCCQPFSDGTYGFCVDPLVCSCGSEGATCGTTGTAKCCAGTHCAGTETGGFKCLKDCLAASDCSSNCCVQISTGEYSICEDAATYCRY
jgi:hypothetical protein